jgi:phage shock protein PspC (stress-responsive transcriptional regulator)
MTADHDAPAAKDNLLGVCAAIGEDFGFDPLYLRIAFATALLFNLEGVLGAYLFAGVLVLATRLLFPNPKPAPAPVVAEELPEETVPVPYALAA